MTYYAHGGVLRGKPPITTEQAEDLAWMFSPCPILIGAQYEEAFGRIKAVMDASAVHMRALANAAQAAAEVWFEFEDLHYSPAERRRRARRRARLAAKNPTSTALWTAYRAKTRRRNRKARR